MLAKTVEKYHYSPKPVDDQYSRLVFATFMKLLDPDKMLFTQQEAARLEAYKEQIDDNLAAESCELLKKAAFLYEQRLYFTDSLLAAFEATDFDYDKEDTIVIGSQHYPSDAAGLSNRWRKYLKYQIELAYFFTGDTIAKSRESFLSKEKHFKDQAIAREKCKITSRLNHPDGIDQYVGDIFLKSLAYAFDPHSMYFQVKEKNEFDKMLSKETRSFGIQIQQNELGEIVVGQVVPGSPAWNSNKLNNGDVILSVMADNGVSQDFDCLSLDEAVYFLSSPDIVKATFDIRKYNGSKINLTLSKEKLAVEDNVIRSFVLEGEQKMGYINLPSFYSQMDSLEFLPNGCANDMAKELLKLKQEGIKGLIIDLRNNGGGSMLEAIRMAGIFINYGAIAILHNRDEDPGTLKDMSRGTIYNDPLLVLVNHHSASASELFAAAVQDHNRAVIAGSATFGKSTGQNVVPLNAYSYNQEGMEGNHAEAYLKITTSTFYRVDGTNHQKKGVQPDVVIPHIYDRIEAGESALPTALEPSSIDKKTYYYPHAPLPVEQLSLNSAERIKKHNGFAEIDKLSRKYEATRDNYSVPLAYKYFASFFESWNRNDSTALPSRENELFTVKNPAYRAGISSFENAEMEIDEPVMKDIRSDLYINESYQILNDLINLTKK